MYYKQLDYSRSSTDTVYTARDFTGYTLQHLKAIYPHSWSEAAHHFGVALPESTVEQIKNTAIASLAEGIAQPTSLFNLSSSTNFNSQEINKQ